jgi:hypothetical protein
MLGCNANGPRVLSASFPCDGGAVSWSAAVARLQSEGEARATKMARLIESEIESSLKPGDSSEKIEQYIHSVVGCSRLFLPVHGAGKRQKDLSDVMRVAIRVDDKRRFIEAIVLPPRHRLSVRSTTAWVLEVSIGGVTPMLSNRRVASFINQPLLSQ